MLGLGVGAPSFPVLGKGRGFGPVFGSAVRPRVTVFCDFYASKTQALLRQARPAFYYLQLLPAAGGWPTLSRLPIFRDKHWFGYEG